MTKSKPITPEELISYVRRAETPCLPLSQEKLIESTLKTISPIFATLQEMTMNNATTTISIEKPEMNPYVTIGGFFAHTMDKVTKDLPAGITRAFGVALLKQFIEEHFGKGDDDSKEKSLKIWIKALLEVWRADKSKYSKWNI